MCVSDMLHVCMPYDPGKEVGIRLEVCRVRAWGHGSIRRISPWNTSSCMIYVSSKVEIFLEILLQSRVQVPIVSKTGYRDYQYSGWIQGPCPCPSL